jgi:DNA repair protein RadB
MQPNYISSACSTIDALLAGGFPCGAISLIYGEASTGKTSLAIQCAVNCAKEGFKVIFIDGDNAFSVKRLIQIAGSDLNNISNSIFLFTPSSFQDQGIFIENLDSFVSKRVSLIIIDTITSLYQLELSSKSAFVLNRELNRQLAYLMQVCKERDVAAVVLSGVHSILYDSGKISEIEPVANRVLNFWSSITLKLERVPQSRFRKAVLEKHFEPKLNNRRCLYTLTDNGLSRVNNE